MKRVALVVALVVAHGCAPSVIWTGHSPDRRHTIEIARKGNVQWVVIDGKRRAAYRTIAAWSIATAADGRIAYAATRGKRWVVVDHGRASSEWDGVGQVIVAGPRTAYSAERGGQWHVVVDGVVGPGWEAILAETLRFSRDGKHHVYIARDRGRMHVVIDGAIGPPFTGIGQLVISDDSFHVAYAARHADDAMVVVDGRAGPSYAAINRLALVGAMPVYLAQDAAGWHVVTGTTVSAPYTQVRSLITAGGHVAWLARDGATDVVACDGAIVGRAIPPERIADDSLVVVTGCEVAYAIRDATSTRFVRGSTELAYDEIGPITVAHGGSHVGYAARRGATWDVIVDGVARGGGSWVSSPVFSPGGTRVAYLARRGGKMVAVVDGKAHVYDMIMEGTLAFSRDGRRWAVIAGDLAHEQLFFAVDGRRRVPLAMKELYSAAASISLRPMLEADHGAQLRAWSAAEADK